MLSPRTRESDIFVTIVTSGFRLSRVCWLRAGVAVDTRYGCPLPFQAHDAMWFSEQGSPDEPVYRRKLPSGGYVAIATETVQPLFAPAKVRGRIVVERRAEDRREGHPAPIVAIAEAGDVRQILEALVPVAESDEVLNGMLARRATIPITRKPQIP